MGERHAAYLQRNDSAHDPRVAPRRPFALRRGADKAVDVLLVGRRRLGHLDDFHAIAAEIRRIAPDVRPHVLHDRLYNRLRSELIRRPALTVAPVAPRYIRPACGDVCHGQVMSKSQECRRLAAAGLPVPRWVRLTKDSAVDLESFGPYVVVKPDFGARGAEVKIQRRGKVRWKPPQTQRAISQGDDALIVQEFIYTGPWAASYRVGIFFGQPLFSWKVEASHDRRPLAGPTSFRGGTGGGGISIVATSLDAAYTLVAEPDVLQLARRAHAAFPTIPLLGVDIVRQQPSRKLYVLEVNACGYTWHLSSPMGRSMQQAHQLDLHGQFDALKRAAEAVVDQTRRRATRRRAA